MNSMAAPQYLTKTAIFFSIPQAPKSSGIESSAGETSLTGRAQYDAGTSPQTPWARCETLIIQAQVWYGFLIPGQISGTVAASELWLSYKLVQNIPAMFLNQYPLTRDLG